MNWIGEDHVKQNKPDWERWIPHVLSYVESRPPQKPEWHECKMKCLGVPLSYFKRGGIRNSNIGSEFDQSTLYAYMKIFQWNPFV
jgi:hypothetical protein